MERKRTRKHVFFHKAQLWNKMKPGFWGIWTEVAKHRAVWPESVVNL